LISNPNKKSWIHPWAHPPYENPGYAYDIYMRSNVVFEYAANFFHRVPLVHFTANAI